MLLALLLALTLSVPVQAKSVYLFSSGDNTWDNALSTALTTYGHNVTLGVQFVEFDTENISAFDVALLTAGPNYNTGDMPGAGQTNLVNFVNAGHGLVTGEWSVWMPTANKFLNLEPLFPTTFGPDWTTPTTTTYTQAGSDPIINAGLPGSFTFNNGTGESQLAARGGASVFYTTSTWQDAAGLAGWTYGSNNGRVANFSVLLSASEMDDDNFALLLGNTVEWAGNPVPIPGALWLLGSGLGLLGLGGLRRRNRL